MFCGDVLARNHLKLPYDWAKEIDPGLSVGELGIYSACYKLSILMTLFIQAFRYAGEPFFFAYAKASDARQTYALVLNWFVIFCVFFRLAIF